MSQEAAPSAEVTVLGVGNPIMGDDGIGPCLLEAVQTQCDDERVEFINGMISGMELLPVVQDARRLLVLDAVAGTTPGEVVELEGDQIPRLLSSKLSPHQVGLLDLLAAARMLGREPEAVAVVGIVPESVDLSLDLTDIVRASVPTATQRALGVIDRFLRQA